MNDTRDGGRVSLAHKDWKLAVGLDDGMLADRVGERSSPGRAIRCSRLKRSSGGAAGA